MTTLQLISRTTNGAVMQGAYIRDHPDFEFRAASDWLLNIEINGWTWDRGQGVEAFAKLMESKIDRALQYKINMALVDGFGFSVAKRPAFYAPLMRRLNRYARARGIHLIYGGYGASYGMAYEPVVMYEQGEGFKGTVFEIAAAIRMGSFTDAWASRKRGKVMIRPFWEVAGQTTSSITGKPKSFAST